jgi:hypothetical protein
VTIVSTQTRGFDRAQTQEILAELDRAGYVHIPGVLSTDEVAYYRAIVDQLAEQHYDPEQGFVHALGATYLHPALMDLGVDTRLLGVLAGSLTPNIHIYHSHIDVHPPEEETGSAWRWHEDGGRQTADLDFRARLSVKLGWWLSDCDEEGYGNLEVIPGSNHWTEPLPRTPGQTPEGAIPVLAKAGDVTLFERRIWHGRGTNTSTMGDAARVSFGRAARCRGGRPPAPPADRGTRLGHLPRRPRRTPRHPVPSLARQLAGNPSYTRRECRHARHAAHVAAPIAAT